MSKPNALGGEAEDGTCRSNRLQPQYAEGCDALWVCLWAGLALRGGAVDSEKRGVLKERRCRRDDFGDASPTPDGAPLEYQVTGRTRTCSRSRLGDSDLHGMRIENPKTKL